MKYAVRFIVFLLILSLALAGANQALSFKFPDGIFSTTKFYEQGKNTVDLLVLGSSHAYQSFNTRLLWQEQGISAYLLCGSIQPLWNSYYNLLEALKTQTPKLVILEAYMCLYEEAYSDDVHVIKNNFGLRLGGTRTQAIRTSVPEARREELLLSYYQYHNRYTELSLADFAKDQGNPRFADWKGFDITSHIEPFEQPALIPSENRLPLHEKSEEYLRKIITLTQERDIPLLIVVAPYWVINEEQWSYQTVADIAAEYHVPFVNFNGDSVYDAIGLDFAVDMADIAHLNFWGSEKFTRYVLENYLSAYHFSDHRGDVRYDSWQRDSDMLTQALCNHLFIACTERDAALEMAQNKNYQLYITMDGECDHGGGPPEEICQALGIESGKGGCWFVDNQYSEVYWSGDQATGAEWYFQPDKQTYVALLRRIDDYGNPVNWIMVGSNRYKQTDDGMTVVVYDRMTETIVTAFGLDQALDYQMVRR